MSPPAPAGNGSKKFAARASPRSAKPAAANARAAVVAGDGRSSTVPPQGGMGMEQRDQQRAVAASDINDLAERGPVVRGRDRWRLGCQLVAHQRVIGGGPVGMLGEV